MQTGVKTALGITVLFVLVAAGEVAWIHHRNNDEMPAGKTPYTATKTDPDDLVFLRKEHPDSMKDEKALIGRTIWVSAAGQLDYYPYANHHADYAHPAGTLLGAAPLSIKDAFEQVAPKGKAQYRIPGGQRHVLLAFTMPGNANAEYATPVGYYEDGTYTLYTDNIFFYDDPRGLYNYWGPDVWAHIDRHEPAMGMNENQMMLALGQVMKPHGDKMGERSVTYDNLGKPYTVDFVGGKAVRIVEEK